MLKACVQTLSVNKLKTLSTAGEGAVRIHALKVLQPQQICGLTQVEVDEHTAMEAVLRYYSMSSTRRLE